MESENNKKIIQTEQIQQLYSGFPVSLISSTLLAFILCFVLWGTIDHAVIVGWYLLVIVLSIARLGLMLRYRQDYVVGSNADWLLRFRAGAIAAALVWGFSGIVLFPTGNITHQAFLAFFLTGYAAGGAMAYTIDLYCAVPFIIVALTPFMIRLFVAGGEFATTMGMAVALFIVFISILMRRICRNAIEKFVIQLEATSRANDLYESETKLRTLYDSTSDAIMLIGSNTIIDCNKASLELFGCTTHDQILSRAIAELSEPVQPGGKNSAILADEMIQTAINKGSVRFEWHYKRLDNGLSFFADVQLNAMSLNNSLVVQATTRDISERKRNERLMQQWSDAFNHAALGIAIGDSCSENIMACNPAFAKLLGYNAGEIIGHPIYEIYSVPDRKRINQIIKDTNEQGRNQFECQMIRKDGSEVPVQVDLVAVKDSNHSPMYRVATVQDISERNKATQTIIEAKELAERAAQVKSDFLANMSHEIRTPMNGIIGLSELALNQSMNSELRDYLDKISSSSQSLMGILNDILDFSKLEAGGVTIEHIPFDLDALLDILRNMFEERALAKNIGFTIEVTEGVPRDLIGDVLRLQQILTNLLSNAIKFTSRGQVLLKLTAKKLEYSKTFLTFVVEDSGIGMAEEDLNKLFKPFSQVDGSITRKFGGTGLGLAISRDLLKLMGGVIRVNSTRGLGTTFSFDLHLELANDKINREVRNRSKVVAGQLAETLQSVGREIAGIRVLVAEDNRVNQVVVNKFLTLAGMEVVIVNNGQEALDILQLQKFDAILMDMHMPIMGGIEATQNIRAQSDYVDLPIIALTAGVTQEERNGCIASGMNDFITKPVNSKTLIASLLKWVQPH
jgi:PAS domain S-box-containing protein